MLIPPKIDKKTGGRWIFLDMDVGNEFYQIYERHLTVCHFNIKSTQNGHKWKVLRHRTKLLREIKFSKLQSISSDKK